MLLKFKFKFHIKRHVTKKQDKICLITFCVLHFIQILVIQAMDTNKTTWQTVIYYQTEQKCRTVQHKD